MGAQKTPLQKVYEIRTGTDSLNVEFLGSNRQFDWLEMSIGPDKSDKHTTMFESYNIEQAFKETKTLKLTNFKSIAWQTKKSLIQITWHKDICSISSLFVAQNCNGSSIAPLTDHLNNLIFQELPDEDPYFSVKNDERVFLDLRASSGYINEAEKLEKHDSKINLQITLKASTKYKLRIRTWPYFLSEYLYVLLKSGLTLKHRTYAINESDEDFLE